MKVMVTGGAGFVGSNLVCAIKAMGHDVVVVDNFSSGYRSNLEKITNIQVVEGDIRNGSLVAEAAKGCEIIYHLAASVGNKRSVDNPTEDADVNVMGTMMVLEAARKCGVRKIVASSSAGIFGELKTLPIKEDHPIDPDTPYGSSKLCMEKECLAYSKVYGLEAVCLRYFNVYGINQRYDAYGNVIPIFVKNVLSGAPITVFGDGEQTRDFVNVKDVVQANICASESLGISGAFNIGSGSRVTINELIRLIEKASGLTAEVQYANNRPGDVRHSLADISASSRAFGFSPSVSLEVGLWEYISWVKSTSGN